MSDAEGTGYAASGGVPAQLRAAREAAGLTIEQLSMKTRISSRYVAAIEAGEWGALPPGRPYRIGFVRSIARALGLDEEALADATRGELGHQGTATSSVAVNQFEPSDPAKTPTRGLLWLSALAVVLLVAGGLAFWRNYYVPAAGLPELGSDQPAAKPAPPAVANRTSAPSVAPTGGAVVFTALEDKIWAKFYDGAGKQLLQKQLAKGESFTIPPDAQNPQIWTGRPDAFAITIGGKPVARLAEEQRTVKDVPVSATALIARPVPTPVPAASGTATPVAPVPQPSSQPHG